MLGIGVPDRCTLVGDRGVWRVNLELTGVLSSSRSPAMDAALSAASMRSSHLVPISADGSADNALRSLLPGLNRSSFWMCRSQSLAPDPRDFCFLWWASLPRFDTDGFLGRFCPSGLCSGGSVDERPGGELARIEGSMSRGRELRLAKGSLVMSLFER
jgi:hypothetical protein